MTTKSKKFFVSGEDLDLTNIREYQNHEEFAAAEVCEGDEFYEIVVVKKYKVTGYKTIIKEIK